MKKKYFYFALTIAQLWILSGCLESFTSDETAEEGENKVSIKKDAPSTAKEILANRLDGIWLSENYLYRIEKSKSIYQNRKYQTRIFARE